MACAHPPLLSLSDTVDTMTHPFLFHPQAAPWFKESADTLQLTLFVSIHQDGVDGISSAGMG